ASGAAGLQPLPRGSHAHGNGASRGVERGVSRSPTGRHCRLSAVERHAGSRCRLRSELRHMMAEPTRIVSEMRAGLRDIAVASRIFVGVAGLALAGAIGVLAWQQGLFTRTVDVSFYAGTADGMNKGMAVKLVGFKVGSVDSIAVTPDLRVKVDVKLDEKY